MDPENQSMPQEQPPAEPGLEPSPSPAPESTVLSPAPPNPHGLAWLFIGPRGLRAGWSVLLFALLTLLFLIALGLMVRAATGMHRRGAAITLSPSLVLLSESMRVIAILAAGAIMALIERRRILDYNLRGRRRLAHFLGGLAAGFVALSALVGALAWGGWLHLGPASMSGARILALGAVWALAFLLTGFFEEGSFRGYLLFTFTRGLNFWWALGIVATVCAASSALNAAHKIGGGDVRGMYIVALALLILCVMVRVRRAPGASFWYAAWVTSTLFGFLHTGNNGEDWIGIFAAAAVGFVFCVSVWVTGSAWWAIGCHAAWDWSETFFYGTADSGLVPRGHFLTAAPAGNPFWSGGTVGPEGSVLVLGALALLLLILLAMYVRKKNAGALARAAAQSAV